MRSWVASTRSSVSTPRSAPCWAMRSWGVREMSVGPEATIALIAASIIAPLAEGDPGRYLALGAGLALMARVLLLAGVARLGFVTQYLSRPLLVGYVAGSALVMIVSQLDSLVRHHPPGPGRYPRRADRDAPPSRRDRSAHARGRARRDRRRARGQNHRPTATRPPVRRPRSSPGRTAHELERTGPGPQGLTRGVAPHW